MEVKYSALLDRQTDRQTDRPGHREVSTSTNSQKEDDADFLMYLTYRVYQYTLGMDIVPSLLWQSRSGGTATPGDKAPVSRIQE